MQVSKAETERGLMVFAIWAALGTLGLMLIVEGFARDGYALALAGTVGIIAALGGHVIVNAVFSIGFTPGETALGLTAFGLLVLTFVLSVLVGDVSTSDFYAGLTLFAALTSAFVIYLITRHGLRGAFSRFHVGAPRGDLPPPPET